MYSLSKLNPLESNCLVVAVVSLTHVMQSTTGLCTLSPSGNQLSWRVSTMTMTVGSQWIRFTQACCALCDMCEPYKGYYPDSSIEEPWQVVRLVTQQHSASGNTVACSFVQCWLPTNVPQPRLGDALSAPAWTEAAELRSSGRDQPTLMCKTV